MPLSLSQTGLVPSCTSPQALTSLGLTLGATFSWFEVRSVRVYCAQLVVGSRNAKIVKGAKNLNAFVGFILRLLSVSLVRGMRGCKNFLC